MSQILTAMYGLRIILTISLIGVAASAHAQGQFRAVGSGVWSDSRNWEQDNGGIWLKPPDGVFPGESHNRNVDVIIDNDVKLTVEGGPEIRIHSLEISKGVVVISGNMVIGPTSDDPNNAIKITPSNGAVGISDAGSVPETPALSPATSDIPLQLNQNVPNPVSFATGDWTTINFYIDRDYPIVRLSIYDQLGSEIKRIYEEYDPTPGWKSVRINVRELESGSYPIVLQAGPSVLRRSLTVIR